LQKSLFFMIQLQKWNVHFHVWPFVLICKLLWWHHPP
jgi:hypothetical protein